MSAILLWDARRLRRRNLPTLQEAFNACDKTLLKQVIMEDFAASGASIGKRRRAAMDLRLNASLDAMSSLRLSQTNRDWILVPRGSYVLNAPTRKITWHLHTVLVPLCDSATLRGLMHEADDHAAGFQRGRKSDKHGKSLPRSNTIKTNVGPGLNAFEERAYTLAPWEETLAHRVWLGGEWCCRDRYAALASAFWEMTFFGFEYDDVQARIAQEKAESLIGPRSKTAQRSSEIPGAKKRLKASSRLYGLHMPDRFKEEGLEQMARRVASLNHHEQHVLYERLFDLAQRLERGRQ